MLAWVESHDPHELKDQLQSRVWPQLTQIMFMQLGALLKAFCKNQYYSLHCKGYGIFLT